MCWEKIRPLAWKWFIVYVECIVLNVWQIFSETFTLALHLSNPQFQIPKKKQREPNARSTVSTTPSSDSTNARSPMWPVSRTWTESSTNPTTRTLLRQALEVFFKPRYPLHISPVLEPRNDANQSQMCRISRELVVNLLYVKFLRGKCIENTIPYILYKDPVCM